MNIVFAGCTAAYGHSFNAVNTKTRLIAQGLTLQGASCAIYDSLLGYGISDESLDDNGIQVLLPRRRGPVIMGEILNIPNLYHFLKSRVKSHSRNILVLEMPLYHNFLAYVTCGRLLGYKIVIIAHEWAPTLQHVNLYAKLSSFLYTKSFGYLADALLPISEYIISRVIHFRRPYLKVPAIAEFPVTPIDYLSRRGGFFVYCASAGYSRVANLIIDSYHIYKKANGVCDLYLILSGTDIAIGAIRKKITNIGLENNVHVLSQLTYEKLFDYYTNAAALLIPLDPSYEQDIARFPQKLAEYCSTASPIITTNVGEVSAYFDNRSCLIAEFTPISFADKMKWVDENRLAASEIGKNAFTLGLDYFDMKKCGHDLLSFFNGLFS